MFRARSLLIIIYTLAILLDGGNHKANDLINQRIPLVIETTMTYDRMKAKPILGEHCRFCGDKSAPLVQTPCCQQWICCDTAYASLQGGGRCQYEHERFSLCYPHYAGAHSGSWQTCEDCKKYIDLPDYKELYENSTPKF